MTQSSSVEPPTIPAGMTIAEYRRARLSRRKRFRSQLFRWPLHLLALALLALALAPPEAGARGALAGKTASQPTSSGTAVLEGCVERNGQLRGDEAAIRSRVPRRFELYRDPFSGRPLLNVRVIRCRRFAVNGTVAPMTLAHVGVMIESPDGTGCASRMPPVQEVLGNVPPFPWCTYYPIFHASDNLHYVEWLRDGTPEFPAHYVPGFRWQEGEPELTTLAGPFHFEAAAPTPSPFEIDAVTTRDLPVRFPISVAVWVPTRRGLLKVNYSVEASFGEMHGSVRTRPGTEMAELLGAETGDFALGYSLFGAILFDGTARKEIVPAPPSPRSARP